jgi:archaellum component FlaC
MEDIAKNEILEAIGEFSNRLDGELSLIKGEIGSIKNEIGSIKGEVGSIKGEVGSIKGEIMAVKSVMVTKDYLDDKLLDMKGDMVVMMRKEDEKVKTLVNILKNKNLLNEAEAKTILALEPFPNR